MDSPPSIPESIDDPRVTPQFYRRLPGPTPLHLVGVVHDHPASIARVAVLLEAIDPDVLALELPPATLPLYRAYAREASAEEPPRFGGEMAMAVRTVTDADLVGIDAPNWSFLRRLLVRLVADRVSAATARRVISSVGGATRSVVACRLAATLTHATSLTVACDDPIEYDCHHTDPPAEQAAHERSHVAGVQALLGSVDTTGTALTYRDETREQCMVDRLETIRSQGEVVAIVGVDHLEPIAETFRTRADGP